MAKRFGALEFVEFLSRIKDRRRAQGKKWKLEKLLFVALMKPVDVVDDIGGLDPIVRFLNRFVRVSKFNPLK